MRVQRLRLPDGETSWTVLGDDWLPVAPVEEFLEHLRAQRRSPNTVRNYAQGLARWWQFLGVEGVDWEAVSVERLAGFLVWLRSGETSSVVSIVEPPTRLSEATIAEDAPEAVSDLPRGRAATLCYAGLHARVAGSNAAGGCGPCNQERALERAVDALAAAQPTIGSVIARAAIARAASTTRRARRSRRT